MVTPSEGSRVFIPLLTELLPFLSLQPALAILSNLPVPICRGKFSTLKNFISNGTVTHSVRGIIPAVPWFYVDVNGVKVRGQDSFTATSFNGTFSGNIEPAVVSIAE